MNIIILYYKKKLHELLKSETLKRLKTKYLQCHDLVYKIIKREYKIIFNSCSIEHPLKIGIKIIPGHFFFFFWFFGFSYENREKR